MKFNKEKIFRYTQEQNKKRTDDIPVVSTEKGKNKENERTDFIDDDSLFEVKLNDDFVPPSIEYLSKKQKKLLKPQKPDRKLVKNFKENFSPELEKSQSFEFKASEEFPEDKLSSLVKQPEISKEELDVLDLASEDKVQELFQLHMQFYTVLSRIQDTNIASDFRFAYDIQDKISYVLDNRSLLSNKLVEKLIKYLRDIVIKLEQYGIELRRKRMRYTELNHRVSVLKEYKYKTDESFKLLSDNKEILEKGVEHSLNKLKHV